MAQPRQLFHAHIPRHGCEQGRCGRRDTATPSRRRVFSQLREHRGLDLAESAPMGDSFGARPRGPGLAETRDQSCGTPGVAIVTWQAGSTVRLAHPLRAGAAGE